MFRQPPPPHSAFQIHYDKLERVLTSAVLISEAFDPQYGSPPQPKEYVAIWDTGATNTVITQKVVDDLQLSSIGKVEVRTPQGGYIADRYLVHIVLPNNLQVTSLHVTGGQLKDGDALIGMDIIGTGDFAVTNFQGRTCMTFRSPSVFKIDFCDEIEELKKHFDPQLSKVGRNDKCTCGSGKKYKNCHGK